MAPEMGGTVVDGSSIGCDFRQLDPRQGVVKRALRRAFAPSLLLVLGAVASAGCDGSRTSKTRANVVGSRVPAGSLPPRGGGGESGMGNVPCLTPDTRPDGPLSPGRTRFVVLGDYGNSSPEEARVARMIHDWQPDFIITTGDNNYPFGEAETIDVNIGQYFHDFIAPYRGRFGCGSRQNRFFPALGNHDWYTAGAKPYLDYFTLPGNERYYDLVFGDVHLFAIDSDPNEPDGVTAESAQAAWLQQTATTSRAPWQIAYMHHPPFSSGSHLSTPYMQWPYKAAGIDVVFAGHDHDYERLEVDGIPYIVDGLGGAPLYSLSNRLPTSKLYFNETYGAVLVEATTTTLTSTFIAIDGRIIDQLTLTAKP